MRSNKWIAPVGIASLSVLVIMTWWDEEIEESPMDSYISNLSARLAAQPVRSLVTEAKTDNHSTEGVPPKCIAAIPASTIPDENPSAAKSPDSKSNGGELGIDSRHKESDDEVRSVQSHLPVECTN